jgi:hypothetical protein
MLLWLVHFADSMPRSSACCSTDSMKLWQSVASVFAEIDRGSRLNAIRL